MSMNPQAEDFERLALRWADTPGAVQGFPNIIAAITAFPEMYARNRDGLPQNDADRAFGLLARACTVLDRDVNYAETDEAAQRLTDEAAGLLDEALKLDASCWDAVRVRRYLDRPTREGMAAFLTERAGEVRASCEQISRDFGIVPPQGHWSISVYARPYLRWMFDLANEQLSCGRYRLALSTCRDLLDLDVPDAVGARQVAALCCVKLEDPEELAEVMGRYPGDASAWFLLARCFMAYKQRRLDDAAAILHEVVRTFPQAGVTLNYQDELPAGVFGHLEYADGSADELYVAVSEAAVVLDENCGDYLSPLSDWVARDPEVLAACMAEEAAQQMRAPAAPAGSSARPSGRGGAAAQAQAQARPAAPGAASEAAAPSGPAPADVGEPGEAFFGFDDVTCVDDLLAAMGEGMSRSAGAASAPFGPTGPSDPSDPAAPHDDTLEQGR